MNKNKPTSRVKRFIITLSLVLAIVLSLPVLAGAVTYANNGETPAVDPYVLYDAQSGYYYDSETGLYYLMSRYYDPEVGRFINVDGLVSTGGFLGFNMFAYCKNNPVMYSDPTGCAPGDWYATRAAAASAAQAYYKGTGISS